MAENGDGGTSGAGKGATARNGEKKRDSGTTTSRLFNKPAL